ncbi:MAG: AmmeMemoRadiSam system radical SAM enzyme [Victivallales bacterium]|nr:AmmeMemoRadiSam system radical SAM enzyme [Victivallales bacterium]
MKIQCDLCPKRCIISPGESGDCRIRVNIDGRLHAVTYGYPCALHVDPIEKKPLFHFLPGTKAFSIATAGCNLHCRNCQNWEISQSAPVDVPAYKAPPSKIVESALKHNCETVAYTYTDPSAFYEYTLDTSKLIKKENRKNIIVSAGYFNPVPLRRLCRYIDGANIDLKFIHDKYYREICGGTLKPVLDVLQILVEEGVHLEVTNLVIPTLNDNSRDIKKLCSWIFNNLGKNIPLHFSRFYPQYKMKNLPPTSISILKRALNIAKDAGLEYVYIGNVIGEKWESTFCPNCGRLLIEREGYYIKKNVVKYGCCPYCGYSIYGVWS